MGRPLQCSCLHCCLPPENDCHYYFMWSYNREREFAQLCPPDFFEKIPALAMGEPSDLCEKTLDFTVGRLPLLAVIGPQAQRPRVVMLASALPPRGRVYLHTHNHAALSGGPPAREGALDAAGRTPGSSALGRRCPGPCATRGLAQEGSLWS